MGTEENDDVLTFMSQKNGNLNATPTTDTSTTHVYSVKKKR